MEGEAGFHPLNGKFTARNPNEYPTLLSWYFQNVGESFGKLFGWTTLVCFDFPQGRGGTAYLAARIESYTREVNKPQLIEAYTRESLPDSIAVDSLGKITLKGKTLPVQIYSVRTDSDADQVGIRSRGEAVKE